MKKMKHKEYLDFVENIESLRLPGQSFTGPCLFCQKWPRRPHRLIVNKICSLKRCVEEAYRDALQSDGEPNPDPPQRSTESQLRPQPKPSSGLGWPSIEQSEAWRQFRELISERELGPQEVFDIELDGWIGSTLAEQFVQHARKYLEERKLNYEVGHRKDRDREGHEIIYIADPVYF
jgi:hypothetical protein